MKKNLRTFILCLLVGVFLFSPMPAKASLIIEGDPFEIGSWAQRFYESGVGLFDRLEAYMISGDDDFEGPGFKNFDKAGWTASMPNSDHITATGTAYDILYFDLCFADDKSDPLVFDFVAWKGTTLLEVARASWNGSGWSIGSSPIDYRKPVPEPGTMLLLGFGLAGLVGFGRKKLFKK